MISFRVPGISRGRLTLLLTALALVIVAGAASVISFRQVTEADALVRHTWKVKSAAADFLTHLIDAETGQRGYLLTGRAAYLDPYEGACSAARRQLELLRGLTADNPPQQERAIRLSELTDVKLDELKQTIQLADLNNRQGALDIVNSDAGRDAMEEIRALTSALKDEEARLLDRRFNSRDSARRGLLGFILAGLTSAIFFVGFSVRSMSLLLRSLHRDAEALKREIERRKEMEATLVQAQKIEAVGQLTGGIAHDFNNLLTVILGNLDSLLRRIKVAPSGEDTARFASGLQAPIEAAIRAGRSGAQLVRQLLTFARRQALTPEQLDLNRLTSGMTGLIQRTLGETVHVQTVLAGNLWPTFADAVQIETALLNLVVNARDAMPNGGRLTIETANACLDDDYASRFNDVAAGEYVVLSVTDTGAGIPPDVLDHVFEPFFTTKATENGTGLGLAMVHGFVKQSRGHIRIYSELGKGTTVKIYLPRMQSAGVVASKPSAPLPALENTASRARATETVLLVEDNEDVRVYAETILQDLGYRVLAVGDVPAALKVFDLESAVKIDIVFTDVVLPMGMSGAVLAAEIEQRRPGLPILFTTGYTRNAIVHNGILDADVHLINKPYTSAELGRKLRELLDGAASQAGRTASSISGASPSRQVRNQDN